MKEIKLQNSARVALVDDEDFEALNARKWWLQYKGYAYSSGYDKTTKKRTITLMHRLIMENPTSEVDHINRNGLDNRKANLRLASRQENTQNAGLRKDNRTGYKGVHRRKSNGRYQAYIQANKKHLHLGFFDTAEEAAVAYDTAAVELHGAFARLNFPKKSA